MRSTVFSRFSCWFLSGAFLFAHFFAARSLSRRKNWEKNNKQHSIQFQQCILCARINRRRDVWKGKLVSWNGSNSPRNILRSNLICSCDNERFHGKRKTSDENVEKGNKLFISLRLMYFIPSCLFSDDACTKSVSRRQENRIPRPFRSTNHQNESPSERCVLHDYLIHNRLNDVRAKCDLLSDRRMHFASSFVTSSSYFASSSFLLLFYCFLCFALLPALRSLLFSALLNVTIVSVGRDPIRNTDSHLFAWKCFSIFAFICATLFLSLSPLPLVARFLLPACAFAVFTRRARQSRPKESEVQHTFLF